MKIYIVQINGQVIPEIFTSLKGACKHVDISYQKAQRANVKIFIQIDRVIRITQANFNKTIYKRK